MAAYAALVSIMQIFNQIENHPSPPISLDKKQVESLTEIVVFLQEFLEGYKSPFAHGDEVDPLETRIANAAYKAEDVIESHILDQILAVRKNQIGFFNCFRGLNLNSMNLYKVIKDMDLIKKEVVAIIAVKDQLSTPAGSSISSKSRNNSPMLSCFSSWRSLQSKMEIVTVKEDQLHKQAGSSTSLNMLRNNSSASSPHRLNNTIMEGFDDVLLQLMAKLTNGQLCRQVIPIVGMGGIGKTTLARNVYAQPLITHHFDICTWVTISQQYNAKELLCEILSQADKEGREEEQLSQMIEEEEILSDTIKEGKGRMSKMKHKKKLSQANKEGKERSQMNEDEIGVALHKYLSYRRYLVVLDDMWSIEAWEKLQLYFPDNGNGSRIIVTTRLSNLGTQLDNNYSLKMKFMDEESSWNMFCKIVFGGKNCPSELEKIGKKIVESCRGLPLSIVVMGGLLEKSERKKECWESISISLNSLVNSENDMHCLKILKLSYNHLPIYLKPCFLYMGTFDEDTEVRVSIVIKLWVSEGFLKPIRGKSLETIAKEYLDELVDRNLILIHKFGKSGNMKYCKIHDLLRDLCLREAEKERFYHVVGQHSPQGMCNQHRVVIPVSTSKEKVLHAMESTPHARSYISDHERVQLLPNLRLLRTLRACDADFYGGRDFCEKMFKFVNLRLLVYKTHWYPAQLPSSINLLWNLQTIVASHSKTGHIAPIEIWNMPQLRHVHFHVLFWKGALHLPNPPSDNIVVMENLQTLKGVTKFKCDNMMVRRIPNIKKLGLIYRYDESDDDDDYCVHNIERLQKLESLSCQWFRMGSLWSELTLPRSLKSLTLKVTGCRMLNILEKVSTLPLLQKLKLFYGDFATGKWETAESQFLSLKFLSLFSCFNLECWMMESSHFPCLEHLHIERMDLKEIPTDIGEIPTLKSVTLKQCSESAVKSAKRMVEEQEELQGEELSFKVEVWLLQKNEKLQMMTLEKKEELQRLANPNFRVNIAS